MKLLVVWLSLMYILWTAIIVCIFQRVTCLFLQDFLVVFTDRDKDKTMEFIRTLTKVCDPMGIRVAQPRLCNLPNDRTDTFIQNIKGNVTDRTQLVICVLPRNTKDRYDAIKKLCCVDKPGKHCTILDHSTLWISVVVLIFCESIAFASKHRFTELSDLV